MIVTVTLNPAWDKTVNLQQLNIGELNRIQKVEQDAGGKGINVSKTLQVLGIQSIATGFLGGNTGKGIEAYLQSKGIQTDFVWLDAETRTNTKIVESTGTVTEVNEPGPEISEEQIQELIYKLEQYANQDTIFVLAGSIPKGVDTGIYGKLTACLHEHGAKVLLDADGEAFQKALDAKPDFIKPNHIELLTYCQSAGMVSKDAREYDQTIEQLISLAKSLQDQGMETVAITRGSKGALWLQKDMVWAADPIPVTVHSTVGAGDAFVAGMCYGWEKKLPVEENIRLCMAVSAGAVTTYGTKPPAYELIQDLINKTKLTEMS